MAPLVLAEAVYARDYDNAPNNKDDWLDRSNPLLVASPERTYDRAEIFIVHHFREFKEEPPFPVVGLEGTGKVAKSVFIHHVSRERDPWHFNAPTWEVMQTWSSLDCLREYTDNHSSDDSCIVSLSFRSSSVLETPSFMAAALMDFHATFRATCAERNCLAAISAIRRKASLDTDKERAEMHATAYAYIPQWLFFVAQLPVERDFGHYRSCVYVSYYSFPGDDDDDDLYSDEREWRLMREKEINVWSEQLHHECLQNVAASATNLLSWRKYFHTIDDWYESTEWASNVGNPKLNVQHIQRRRTCWGKRNILYLLR